MKIRLLRKWREWPVGQRMEVFDSKAKELIRDGIAEPFEGDMKNAEKMKTDFFKPKQVIRNGKGKR